MTSEQYYAQALSDLSVIRQSQLDAAENIGHLSASVARIEERGIWQERRIGALEVWQQKTTDEAADTGQHDIIELKRQLSDRDKQKVDRRRHYIRLVAAAIVGATVTAIAAAVSALGGCSL